MFLVANITLER